MMKKLCLFFFNIFLADAREYNYSMRIGKWNLSPLVIYEALLKVLLASFYSIRIWSPLLWYLNFLELNDYYCCFITLTSHNKYSRHKTKLIFLTIYVIKPYHWFGAPKKALKQALNITWNTLKNHNVHQRTCINI